LNGPSKKTLSYLIKAVVLLLAGVFIYRRLSNKHDLVQFHKLLSGIDHTRSMLIMSAVFLLMLLNWGLEAAKWRHLTKKLAPISFWEATEAVFCGLTWAIFTPNRIGEYGGRVLFLPPRKRIHGVFAMAVGSFGQNVITNVLGLGAIQWFIWTYLHLDLWLNILFLAGAIAFSVFITVLYFKIRLLVALLNHVKFLRRFHRFFDIMGRYRFMELVRTMAFCLARFAVFSFQYYIIIHLLIPAIPFYEVFLMVFIFLFIQSALPSLDLLDIGVRSITAVTLFTYVTDQKIAVMAAVSAIWLVNSIIPAILGSAFIFNLKFFDNNS
jgi:uncharacterized membrane protein YbhN (UPF0104 family)